MGLIGDFIKQYAASGYSRFHMPMSIDNGQLTVDSYFDITEIAGADSLYNANGIIMGSEQAAARLYGSGAVLYSAGGSTLCVQTMTAMAADRGSRIIAGRDSHISFANSCLLLGLEPEWIFSKPTPDTVEQKLRSVSDAAGVFVTSPSYTGEFADIAGIADVCRKYSKPLLVDNAHGAHLPAFGSHPISLGADYVCDSAHKTLPALTPAALLHLKDGSEYRRAKDCMSIFGSTSPSYPVLASLERAVEYLFANPDSFTAVVQKRDELGETADKSGLSVRYKDIDAMKFIIDSGGHERLGQDGITMEQSLLSAGIMPEYAIDDHILLMLSPFTRDEDYSKLRQWITHAGLSFAKKADRSVPSAPIPQRVYSMKETRLLPKKTIPIPGCAGEISAANKAVCPPGSIIIAAGERIDQHTETILQNLTKRKGDQDRSGQPG